MIMANKSSKQQPKQPNAANIGHTATRPTTSQPAYTSEVDTHAPESTHLSFFNYITVAIQKKSQNFSSSQLPKQRAKISDIYGNEHMKMATKKEGNHCYGIWK